MKPNGHMINIAKSPCKATGQVPTYLTVQKVNVKKKVSLRKLTQNDEKLRKFTWFLFFLKKFPFKLKNNNFLKHIL